MQSEEDLINAQTVTQAEKDALNVTLRKHLETHPEDRHSPPKPRGRQPKQEPKEEKVNRKRARSEPSEEVRSRKKKGFESFNTDTNRVST